MGFGLNSLTLGKVGRQFSRIKRGHVQSKAVTQWHCKNNPVFSVLVSLPEKINRIWIFLKCCMSEWETDQLTQLLFADADLKAELIPKGGCSLKSAVSREVFKSLWPFLCFPVCLYRGRGGPHWHKFKKSHKDRWSLSCPPIPAVDCSAPHCADLTLTPSSVLCMSTFVWLCLIPIAEMNQCLLASTSMTKSSLLVLDAGQLPRGSSIVNAGGSFMKSWVMNVN